MIFISLEEIKNYKRDWLTCAQAASVLGCHPQSLHDAAIDTPYLLGFPVICMSRRVRIPRLPFIEFMTRLGPKDAMNCRRCGAELLPEAAFCHLCGAKQATDSLRRSPSSATGRS